MPELEESDFRSAVDAYVSSKASGEMPPADWVIGRGEGRRRLRRVALAATVLVLVAGGASVTVATLRHPAQQRVEAASRSNPAHRTGGSVSQAKPHPVGRTKASKRASASAKPAITVRGEGVRVAAYNAPTLTEFASSGYVARAAAGKVVDSRTYVSNDGADTVWTVLTIQTQDPLNVQPSTTLTARELGGVVTLGDVRSEFESKLGPIPADKLSELVDYNFGQQHAAIGDSVLLLLRSLPAGDTAQYAIAARLTLDPSDGLYKWNGEAPNPSWVTGIPATDVAKDFSGLLSR